jgi:hypothetical protein
MVGRPPAAVLPWVWIKRIEPTLIVEIIDRVRDEPFKAVLFDPVRDRFRKEVLLVLVVSKKIICHGWILVSGLDSS